MSVVENFLKKILKEKNKLTNAASGSDFEERIKAYLRREGVAEMVLDTDETFSEYVQSIKPIIQAKSGNSLLPNTLCQTTTDPKKKVFYSNCYVWQPYGQQDFPDFLVFTENKIFTIEIKYSTKKQKKPMWNGNLPKKDALYIFGSYGNQDLTVFRGEDILPEEERLKILSIWDEIDKAYQDWEDDFKQDLEDEVLFNEYGFSPYIRKAYEQGRCYNENAILDFLGNEHRKELEQSALAFVKEADKPEEK